MAIKLKVDEIEEDGIKKWCVYTIVDDKNFAYALKEAYRSMIKESLGNET